MADPETRNYLAWKQWSGETFGRYTREESVYFGRELAQCGVQNLRDMHVLELGFGNGAFAGWARDAGGHWAGLEQIPALLERARKAGFETFGAEQGLTAIAPPSGQDCVVAFDVLEHLDLDAIRSFLRGVHLALKPGGILIARTPSGDSPFSGAVYRGDVTHRTLLGSGAVRQLAMELDFEVLQIRAPVLPIRGLGPIRAVRRVALKVARAAAFAVIRILLMGHRNAVVSPNMVVVLRRGRPGP